MKVTFEPIFPRALLKSSGKESEGERERNSFLAAKDSSKKRRKRQSNKVRGYCWDGNKFRGSLFVTGSYLLSLSLTFFSFLSFSLLRLTEAFWNEKSRETSALMPISYVGNWTHHKNFSAEKWQEVRWAWALRGMRRDSGEQTRKITRARERERDWRERRREEGEEKRRRKKNERNVEDRWKENAN